MEEGGWCGGCVCVLHNLSVTGLDFHTVPDSVAPHSHGHPHRVPYPSRWSTDCCWLLWIAFHFLLSGGTVFTHRRKWIVWALIFPLLSRYQETSILVSERLRPCCPLTFRIFFSLLSSISMMGGFQTPVLSLFEPSVWLTSTCQCYTEFPSILSVHQGPQELDWNIGMWPQAWMISSFPHFLSHCWASAVSTQRCWEVNVFGWSLN